MSQRVLIIGAGSDIAQAAAALLARSGSQLVLAARDMDECERIAQDLRTRYDAKLWCVRFDALDFASHQVMFDAVVEKAGELSGILVCHGLLGSQQELQENAEKARAVIDVNYTSFVSVLEIAAKYFAIRRGSFMCAIGSVAGDRGRQSNHIYGSAKAGVAVYMQGLRNRLHDAGVAVITIKPGFVATKMTHGLKTSRLTAAPERVARDIVKAIRRRRNVVYTPWFWRWIMLVIRMIPEFVFKRMKM